MKSCIILLVGVACVFAFPDTRIISGKPAEEGQFPYHVAITVLKTGSTTRYRCGGGLIGRRLVLSAAHCFDHGTTGYVRVGSTDFYGGQEIYYFYVHKHENYNTNTLDNDIAIAHLDDDADIEGVNFNNIAVIPINFEKIEDGDVVTVSGHGLTSPDGWTNKLMYTQLKTVNTKRCNFGGVDPETTLCLAAGPNGESTCQGDSGGIGTVGKGINRSIVSIVSFGDECMAGYPEVHTRVSAYSNWIKRNIDLLE